MSGDPRSAVFRPDLLAGKICLVSGAGSGLGREITLELCRLGATVVGCGRRTEPLAETATLAAGLPGAFEHHALDIREDAAVEEFVDQAVARHGRIDLLVNNAGGQFLAPAEQVSAKGFRTVVELNLVGTWLMTHAVATKAFIPQESGKVISITLSPHNGMPGMVHSGAARAGVENMMRTLAIEWSRFGIRTCAIAPGQIATEVIQEKYPREVTRHLAMTIPAGRLGRPEEIAWLVAYLAGPGGDFVSGTTFTVDGARDNHFGPWPPPAFVAEGPGNELPAEERRPREPGGSE